MATSQLSRAGFLRALAITAMVASPSLALAGGCPVGKAGIDVRKPNATPGQGVTDHVLGSIDLGKEPIHIQGRLFRFRRLVVQPGGVVPWHSHSDRPALIYILSGQIYEYSSTCSVPILHKAGDTIAETHLVSHWWKNTGKVPAVILAADLFPEKGNAHMM